VGEDVRMGVGGRTPWLLGDRRPWLQVQKIIRYTKLVKKAAQNTHSQYWREEDWEWDTDKSARRTSPAGSTRVNLWGVWGNSISQNLSNVNKLTSFGFCSVSGRFPGATPGYEKVNIWWLIWHWLIFLENFCQTYVFHIFQTFFHTYGKIVIFSE